MEIPPVPNNNPPCCICGFPLFDPEVRLNRQWHFDCNKCQICGEGPLAEEQIVKCLNDKQPVSHTICLKQKLFEDFKNQVIPVTKSHVDALNSEINRFFPAVSPSATDAKMLFDLLVTLQETASNVSAALNLTKDKLLIRESKDFAEKTRAKRAEEAQAKLETEIEKLERQKRTDMFKAERDNPMLRHRRKAIEGYMAMGFSETEAEEAVRKAEQKKLESEIKN